MAKPTRLFFVADLHGSERCFRKFVNAASAYRADVLLVGGDVASKILTPLFPEDGAWVGDYQGRRRRANSTAEVEAFEADLRASGAIPHRVERKTWQALQLDRPEMDRLFRDLAIRELSEWLDLAKTRLGPTRVRTLIGLGNDDFTEMEEVIGHHPYVALTDNRLVRLDDHHELLTIPYSNPTPWRTNRELPEAEIGERIEAWARRLEHPEQAIFNIHVPPRNTPLDLAPKLDENLTKLMGPGGDPELAHVGSAAVREAIERHQPLLGLH